MSSSEIAWGLVEGYALIWVGFIAMAAILGLVSYLFSQK